MKNCGVLLHISSLPSRYGIGSLGDSAYAFADFLHAAGQTYWQVLPLNPTSFGDSPYQAPSTFAGNPYFIDLDRLRENGLLTKEELRSAELPQGKVDYGAVFATRMPVLHKAFARFDTQDPAFNAFCKQNAAWLEPYALFTALKDEFGLRPHWEWPTEYARFDSPQVRAFAAEHARELDFVRFLQYTFDTQWHALKSYVNALGLRIIGDAPIYAAYDSADFWQDPDRFAVGKDGKLTEVAGVPPDYFSADGQLWGNPLYNWQALARENYRYWVERIGRAFSLYDELRIDHFRGFCAYYAIAAKATTAREGVWRDGPGKALFTAVENALGKVHIIAEDLGVDSPELRALLRDCGYPGMKVLQFGFDGNAKDNAHAVGNFTQNCVAYTGTHDNDTAAGWFSALSSAQKKRVRNRLPAGCGDIAKAMICALYRSKAQTAIVPMQDWLRQKSDARMNTPGTGEGNWSYRLTERPSAALCSEMRQTAEKYGRFSR